VKPLRKIGALLWEVMCELADERAYRRHLERQGCAPSPAEWRRFSDRRLKARYAQVKCC
jgi:hypothetical protein